MMMMMGGGLALQGFGAIKSMGAASDYNRAQIANLGLDRQVEQQRRNLFELQSRAESMANLRAMQRAKSVALTNSTAQGTGNGFGYGMQSSGLQGGYAQIAAQGGVNELALGQNLQIGRNTFDLNSQISQNKITMAQAQGRMQQGQGISQLGSSLTQSASAFGRLGSGGMTSQPGMGFQGYGSFLGSSSSNAIY